MTGQPKKEVFEDSAQRAAEEVRRGVMGLTDPKRELEQLQRKYMALMEKYVELMEKHTKLVEADSEARVMRLEGY